MTSTAAPTTTARRLSKIGGRTFGVGPAGRGSRAVDPVLEAVEAELREAAV
jgi:hypothetical protein